jgi:hypothetical protein
MTWDLLNHIGSLLQVFASLATLGALVVLLRQTGEMTKQSELATTATMAGLYQEIAKSMIELDMALVDRPHLRKYFYEGIAVTQGHQDYDGVMSLSEAYLDFMDLVIVLERVASSPQGRTHLPWSDWKTYFRDVYDLSPGMRMFWSNHGKWYSNTLADVLNR